MNYFLNQNKNKYLIKMIFYSKYFLIFFFLFQNISPLIFNLKAGDERCLIDEFLEKNYFVVKYKIYTEYRQNVDIFLPKIHFHLKDAKTNELLYTTHIINAKDKISKKVEKTGLYKVCLTMDKYIPREISKTKLYVNLKITSDNMEKNDFTKAIKSEDVNRMQQKADSIIRIINHATELQKQQLNAENENSLDTLSNAKRYKYLNFGQLIIAAIIGLIQLNNFRKFLKSKNIV